jgi:hypothetical protein
MMSKVPPLCQPRLGSPESSESDHLLMYAEITTEGEGRVVCQRCKEAFPSGTGLIEIVSMELFNCKPSKT